MILSLSEALKFSAQAFDPFSTLNRLEFTSLKLESFWPRNMLHNLLSLWTKLNMTKSLVSKMLAQYAQCLLVPSSSSLHVYGIGGTLNVVLSLPWAHFMHTKLQRLLCEPSYPPSLWTIYLSFSILNLCDKLYWKSTIESILHVLWC